MILPATFSAALDVRMSIDPKHIALNETATLHLIIEGTQNNIQAPSLPNQAGLRIQYKGPMISTIKINGKYSREIRFNYEVSALKKGRHTIGPYNISVNKKIYPLQAVTLDVKEAKTLDGEFLFAEIHASETNLITQQIIELEISIYSRSDIELARNIEQIGGLPETGFKKGPIQTLASRQERIGNHIYRVQRFRFTLRPLTSGTFELSPAFRLYVLQARKRQRRDFFSLRDFWERSETKPYDIKTKPLLIKVSAPPEKNKPSDFSGAVGNFRFDAKASPTTLNEGDPITLRMTIQGAGNIDTILPPEISQKHRFKIYKPKLIINKLDDSQTSGHKVYEQVLIPKRADIKEVPAIKFSYFNVKKHTYETISRGPFPLTIHAVSNQAPHIVSTPTHMLQHNKKLIGEDIIYLKPLPRTWKRNERKAWYLKPLFLSGHLIPIFAFASCYFISNRRKGLQKDTARARRLQAPKHARVAIKKAELAIEEQDATVFYEALWEALTSYFANRLNLAPGEVTPENVHLHLQSHNADSVILGKVNSCFQECEIFRFSPSSEPQSTTESLKTKLQDINAMLKACEKLK